MYKDSSVAKDLNKNIMKNVASKQKNIFQSTNPSYTEISLSLCIKYLAGNSLERYKVL